MNTHDGEDVDAEDFQKEAPKSSPVPAAEMEVEAENRPVEMSNSDTESDQQEEDTNLPPRGRFPKLSFQDLEIHFKKSRSKRRHKGVATHTKELRRTRKSNKRFRELPERSYPKAPLKLSKVSTGEAFSEWISWAKKVFKRQKLERTKRLGPRDLGYHDNMSEKPSTPPGKGGKKMNRPKSELDFTPKLPDPIDDRKLPDWEKAKPPKLNRGVLDLPQDSIYAVLNTWGFIRAFRYPLGINEVIGEGVDMKLEDFVRCFSNTEDDLSLVGTIFSSIAALSLDAGTLDPKKDVLLDDGKRSWMAVNMLTWQWHVSNYLENLEEKRITAMAGDEEDDGGKDDLKNGIMSNSTPRELQYYSKERDALSNDMAYTLPFQSKIRLLALLIDKALCSSKTLHKHLDEGISLMRECSIRHRKQKTLKKQKNQKSVSAECASVYADIVAQVVRSQASSSKKKKETKEQLATAKAELVRKAEKYIDDLEMEKEGERQKEVAALMAKYPLRATTLMGKDRWLRRYYVFGNHASKEASAIYVFDPAAETTTTTTTMTTNQCWGAYETKEQFDRLLKFLSPCGMRESHLLKGLKEHNWKWPPKAQKKAKSQLDSKSKSSPVTPARQKARKRTGKTPGRYKVAGDVEESTTTTTTNSNNPGKIKSPATTAKKEEDTDTATTTTAKPAVDRKSAFSSPSSLAKINSPPITSMRAAAAAATAKLQNGTKAMEDDYDDSEDEIDSPYITKKLTRNMKREELSSNFKPPDINAPLQSDPKEKEYFAKMIQAKKGLIASQLLFRLDGCYLPVCYVCQETLGEDEWHCPYTHRTFKKSEYTQEEFAVLLDEGKREFESGDIIDYNKVSHPLKILKALLMDVEATIPEESTREASKRDINKKREKWIDRVKYALDFTDLATALMQLQGSLRDRWLRPWFKSAEWREAVKKVSTESELAALLYAFDRAILYTPKFKDVCEAEKDKDGKVKTSCEEFPTPNTFPKHQIEFNISAGSDHGPDFRELYGDPRTRINHIHSKATIIFRKNKHVVILGGREASQDDEDDEPAPPAPPATDSATTGDNKMDIDEKKAKVVTAAMSVKTRDLLKHFLELKRKRLEKEEKIERRAPGRSRYGVANPIVRYHGPCPPTYQPEDMEDPDPADETDEDDDEDDDDDGAAAADDDDDDEQHDNHEENAPENPDKDAKSTDNADNGMEVEEDGDGKGGNANGK